MIDTKMFFDGWEGLARVLVLGILGYGSLIVMLRLSRKRTLAQMNVFDFVYVVAMGELLAVTILSEHVSLAEGLLALGLLLGLSALLSWLTTRSAAVEHLLNGEPALLMRRGRFLHDAMREQRVTEKDILTSVREQGVGDLEDVEAVVLETNGQFSVIHPRHAAHRSALSDVPGAQPDSERFAKRGGNGRSSDHSAIAPS